MQIEHDSSSYITDACKNGLKIDDAVYENRSIKRVSDGKWLTDVGIQFALIHV
jgi:hypothetical protein